MKVLGIDPSLSSTGWAFIEGTTYVEGGTINTSIKEKTYFRLLKIYLEMKKVISQYNPDVIAMEETFINKNGRTSLKLGMARGAIMTAIANAKIDLYEYTPCQIKKLVLGKGNASKKEILSYFFSQTKREASFDVADAYAVCLAHILLSQGCLQ